MFATEYLGNLLQTYKAPYWVLELLITQLYDPAMDVCQVAVHFLEKACESLETLESVVNMRPTLEHLGEVGAPLLLRFLSTSVGFSYLRQADYIDREMDEWLNVSYSWLRSGPSLTKHAFCNRNGICSMSYRSR